MAWFDRGEAHVYYEESGAGEPLLMLPGWAGSIDEFAGLRKRFEPRFRVILADLPGSGKSGPQPRTYTPTFYQDDARLFLEMLDAIGASPAHLVGFSDGGEYALLMAALKPEAARSLVTWGSSGSLGNNPEMADPMLTLVDDPIPPMKDFSDYMKAAYGEDNARVMAQSAGRAFRSIIEAGGDISRSLASKITCPALLIAGAVDALATPALVSDMANAIPNGRYLEAKGADHAIHHEQPDWLADTLADWFSKQ